jgi:G protein-coupled receptor Mth (Methuselah protein)
MCESHTAHVFSGSTYRNVYCAMCSGVPVQQLACQQGGVFTRGNFNKDFNLVAFAVLFDFGRGHGSVGAASCPESGQLYDPFLGVCRSLVCPAGAVAMAGNSRGSCVAHDLRRAGDLQPQESAASFNDTHLSCESQLLTEEEFSVMKDEMKLIVATTGAQLEQDKYQVLENGSALICNPTQFNFTLHNDAGDKFGAMLGYITLVGLGISIICLSLHLLATCLVSERSSHGSGSSMGNSNSAKNLASLCVALLIAYCSFLAGQLVRDDRSFCVSSAIVTYYSFLAAFTWMFAVSLDIWRSLRLATTQLRTSYSGRKQWRKFLLNSVCCWLIPGCIVLASVVVENAAPGSVDDEMRPGFGIRPGICWFSNRRSLLVFFAAPISIIMLLNAIFFTSSALMIYSTTASTSGGPRRDFRLYLRLAVLMGLTWSVGLLAGFLDTPLLWVVFVVLNTLQGLFIFLGFTCTEKMSRSLRETFCHCWCCWRRHRRHRRGDLVSSSLGAPPGDPTALGVRKLGVPNSLDHLPWSAFSSSVISSKSSQSEESSRDTDETLY